MPEELFSIGETIKNINADTREEKATTITEINGNKATCKSEDGSTFILNTSAVYGSRDKL